MKIIKAKITKDSTLVATYKDENGTTTVEGDYYWYKKTLKQAKKNHIFQ